jgi:hypothetical protein
MGDTKCSGRRSFATACFFGALTVLCAPSAFSQTLTTGHIAGVVKHIAGVVKEDARGAVVPSAIVTLKYAGQNDRSQSRQLAVSPSISQGQNGNPGSPCLRGRGEVPDALKFQTF